MQLVYCLSALYLKLHTVHWQGREGGEDNKANTNVATFTDGWAGVGWAGLAGLGWAGGGHAAPSHTAAVWAGPGVDILTIIIITMLQAAIISTILDYRFGAFDCNGIRLRMIT